MVKYNVNFVPYTESVAVSGSRQARLSSHAGLYLTKIQTSSPFRLLVHGHEIGQSTTEGVLEIAPLIQRLSEVVETTTAALTLNLILEKRKPEEVVVGTLPCRYIDNLTICFDEAQTTDICVSYLKEEYRKVRDDDLRNVTLTFLSADNQRSYCHGTFSLPSSLSDRERLHVILSSIANDHLQLLISVIVHQIEGDYKTHWQMNRYWRNQVMARAEAKLKAAGMNRDVHQYFKEQTAERQDDFIDDNITDAFTFFTGSGDQPYGHSTPEQIDNIISTQ